MDQHAPRYRNEQVEDRFRVRVSDLSPETARRFSQLLLGTRHK
jgi:hypothetical protein